MMITDKKLREAFLTDVEPYAETEKLLMEALDSTVPEKESKKVNTSIATDRKVSGREGERIVVGFLAMAAIAVIAVVLFKLIPSLRSPVSTDPGPDESVPPMETLVTGGTEGNEVLPTVEILEDESAYTYQLDQLVITLPELWRNPGITVVEDENKLAVMYRGLTLCQFYRFETPDVLYGGDPLHYTAQTWDLGNGYTVELTVNNWPKFIHDGAASTANDIFAAEGQELIEYTSPEDLADLLYMTTGKKYDIASVLDRSGDGAVFNEAITAGTQFIMFEVVPRVSLFGEQSQDNTTRFCLVRSSADGTTITEADGTVLGTFPGMRAVYKKKPYGNTVYLWQQMQDYGTDGGSACILDDVMLWKKSEPLALLLMDEISTSSRLSGDAGFFDIEKGSWLMEPEHVDHFRLIGDCLWTEQADVFAQYETLRRFDGSIIAGRTQPSLFYEHSGFITDTYQTVYDFSGNVLLEERDGSAGEELLDMLEGKGYVVRARDLEDQTLIYSFDRELLSRETSGLVYRGHCGSYLNWIAGGQHGEILPGVESLVTTLDLEQGAVLTESGFLEKNPQYAEGMDEPVTADTTRRDYLNISVCGVTADTIVILLEGMDSYRYICCDKDFYELSPSRTITLDPDYTEIRYREHGFEIHSFFDPEVSDGRDTLFPFNDYRNAFAYIPIREATETEKKEMNDTYGFMESFWLGNTEYRMSDKFFWSEADGACVFIEEDGKDQVYAILDRISGVWNTEITTR